MLCIRLCYARKNRYFKRSHISEARFRAIIRYFAPDLPASNIAELGRGYNGLVDMGYKKHFRCIMVMH